MPMPIRLCRLHPRWLMILAFCWVLGGCAGQAVRRDLSDAERREDLEYLATIFAEREQSFTPESRARFQERLAEAEAHLGAMSHDDFIVGIQRAVVATGNGHTEALLHEHQRLRIPIDVEWFSDGLFVVAARPGYEDLLAGIEKRAPRNAIVDLRLNGGGNYELTAPFAERLPVLLPDHGRLVLVVGNRTFSAAIATAAILKVRAGERAVIVGETIGDDLQFWSEGGFLTLPNSGLRVHFSDGYHDWKNGYDPVDPRNLTNPRIAAVNKRYSVAAGSLEPDVSIPLIFDDYAAGRDPIMEEVASLLRTTAP